jgi:hypothetical protein
MGKLFFILLISITAFAKEGQNYNLFIQSCENSKKENCKTLVNKTVQYHFREFIDKGTKNPPLGLADEIKVDDQLSIIHFAYLKPKKIGYRKNILVKTVKLQIRDGVKVLDSKKIEVDDNSVAQLDSGSHHYFIKIEIK